MSDFVPWNSRSLSEWRSRYAPGEFVDLDGFSTHFVTKGKGSPLVLVHGFNMDQYTWMHNIDALALERNVFAFDLWGLGFSQRESVEPGYDTYSRQLLYFLDELDVQKATLIGHSMGGGTITQFAANHPGRVEKLILVDSTGVPNPLPLRSKFFMLPGVGEFLMGLNNDYLRRKNLGELWMYDKKQLTDLIYEKLICFQKIIGTSEILLRILRKRFFHTLTKTFHLLNDFDFPVMIIWGKNDLSVPLMCGEEMHRIINRSKLRVIKNGAHMPNFDEPKLFNQLVSDFING